MNWKKFVEKMVGQMLGSISEDLLNTIRDFAVKFRADARATSNPWDDILADLLCGILGISDEAETLGGSSQH